MDDLDRKKQDVGAVAHSCKEIVDQGYTSDVKGCKEQVESLKRQLAKLEERGKSRESDLDAMLLKLEKFYDDYDGVMGDIEHVSREERGFKPIGGDVETIRMQQKEFKAFTKENMEPLAKKIDKMNKVGQGLVQSAAAGVNTGHLESDIEKLNDKWNELKEKASSRLLLKTCSFIYLGNLYIKRVKFLFCYKK